MRQKHLLLGIGFFLLAALLVSPILSVPCAMAESKAATNDLYHPWRSYIVVLQQDDTSEPRAIANEMANRFEFTLHHVYRHAIKGFSALIPAHILDALRNDNRVKYIEPDTKVYAFGQTIPTGVSRIGADLNITAKIDGKDDRVDVDVAVIDSGIDLDHPDLNVLSNVSFVPFTKSGDDDCGHGSHVAGIIGALDNGIGVVGVAPGARLHAVKVLNKRGAGKVSQIIAGIDWVSAHANEIEVANMSLGTIGYSQAMRDAIINSENKGIVYVAAAGDNYSDIYGQDKVFGTGDDIVPAAYPEVATVSSMVDLDGLAGGEGGTNSQGFADDTLAPASNFSQSAVKDNPVISQGAGIDFSAPGIDIISTYKNGGYTTLRGTSMASAYGAGCVALYIAKQGRASYPGGVAAIRQALINLTEPQAAWRPADTKDPDSNKEGLLNAIAIDPPVSAVSLVSISIEPVSASLLKGKTQQYTAIGRYSNLSARDLTTLARWASSNGSVATINSSGLATGTGEGAATITAQSEGITSNSAQLKVSSLSAAQLTVSFGAASSRGSESISTVSVPVNLSAATSSTVTVNYAVVGGTASAVNLGSAKDYTLASGTLTFEAGSAAKTIPLTIIDDAINEADETIEIRLSSPTQALLGGSSLYTYTIIDNDRKSLANVVTDFGAKADGVTDDTRAIQAAVDATYSKGGGVIIFPAGAYLVTSVKIKENITYQGYGALMTRPPMQPEWTKTFTTAYAGNQDSLPLIIKGLSFDGNSQNQGPYQNWELEHSHFIFLYANMNYPGRLQAIVEDCKFQNGVADAISVYTNVNVKVYNCEATNVFRGGFVLTGGYSSAQVTKLTTRGEIDPTGIDIEVDGAGYGGTKSVNLEFNELNLLNGDFDVALTDGSTVIGNNIVSGDGPFYLVSQNSKMRFTNSSFKMGAADGLMSRILLPYDIVFENCDLCLTRSVSADRNYKFFAVADIWWQYPSLFPTQKNQSLVFNNCRFLLDDTFKPEDITYVIYSRQDASATNNTLTVKGGCISKNFDQKVVVQSGGVSPTFISTTDCP